MQSLQVQDKGGIKGRLHIRKYKHGILIAEQHETNKVVSSNGHGRNLIVRQLAGDTTHGIEVDEGKIGDDNTAPTDSDTDLGNAVVSNITVEASSFSNDEATFSFFILDGDLADGTYHEFGMFIGGQMLNRALFTNPYSKSTGEDTRVDVTITLT